MQYKPHAGKTMSIRWYAHLTDTRDGVFEVLRAERARGRVGRIEYCLKSTEGELIRTNSDLIAGCRVITAA